MLKKFWFIFIILIIEGSSLMAVELIGAKLLAPFFGSSLYVWTAVLGITVLGLTLGYYIGGQIAKKETTEKQLILILSLAALLVFALPAVASYVIRFTASMGLITGVCVASFLLLVPPMLLFGLVGPLVVKLMAQKMETLGNVAGIVYFTSTLGGIAATFLYGFYLILEAGVNHSSLITAASLAMLPIVYFVKSLITGNKKIIPSSAEQIVQPQKAIVLAKSVKKSSIPQQIRNTVYLFAVVEGATVMAVELMSARMLAPYFGSSLYVWGAVIGITLLSLALGYYTGGRLADKFHNINTIYWVLLASSVFLLSMHYFSFKLTLAFWALDMRIAVVLVSLLLVLPPLLFMGMVPTMLIRYITTKIDNAGTITGRIFTVSSASGILALPLMGFYIIPNFGLTRPSLAIGLIVGILPFVRLVSQKKYISLVFIVFLILSYSQRMNASSSRDIDVLYYSEGLLGQVLVADIYKNGIGESTDNRILFVNRMGQTVIDKTTNRSYFDYITFSTSVASKLPENSTVLVLGLGGGSLANILHNNLKFNVDAIELDERIVDIAHKYFSLNPGIKVYVDDARHYLETTTKKYDLIFFDVFKGDIPPPHVLSLQCFKRAKSLLNNDGIIIVNFNGFLNGDIGIPGRSVYKTLNAADFETKILPTPGEEKERNTLFIASTENQDYKKVRSPLLYAGNVVNMDSLFLNTKGLEFEEAIVFTDNKSNLDRLNIKAANIWRNGYNQTYTKFFLKNGIPLFN